MSDEQGYLHSHEDLEGIDLHRHDRGEFPHMHDRLGGPPKPFPYPDGTDDGSILVAHLVVHTGHPFPTTIDFTYDPAWDKDQVEARLNADGTLAEMGKCTIEDIYKLAEALREARLKVG